MWYRMTLVERFSKDLRENSHLGHRLLLAIEIDAWDMEQTSSSSVPIVFNGNIKMMTQMAQFNLQGKRKAMKINKYKIGFEDFLFSPVFRFDFNCSWCTCCTMTLFSMQHDGTSFHIHYESPFSFGSSKHYMRSPEQLWRVFRFNCSLTESAHQIPVPLDTSLLFLFQKRRVRVGELDKTKLEAYTIPFS